MQGTSLFGLVAAGALALVSCSGGTSVAEIAVGDCFNDPGTAIVETLEVVDCSEPHDNEVYANLLVDEVVFPGDEAISRFALDACLAPFEAYVGIAYEDSPLDYAFLAPTADSWTTAGDRNITCFLYSADLSQLTGSVRVRS